MRKFSTYRAVLAKRVFDVPGDAARAAALCIIVIVAAAITYGVGWLFGTTLL